MKIIALGKRRQEDPELEHQARLCGKILSKNKTDIFRLNYYGLLKSGTPSSAELLPFPKHGVNFSNFL